MNTTAPALPVSQLITKNFLIVLTVRMTLRVSPWSLRPGVTEYSPDSGLNHLDLSSSPATLLSVHFFCVSPKIILIPSFQ